MQKISMKQVTSRVYSSTMKKEAKCSSETSGDFQRTILCYIPEDRTLFKFCWIITILTRAATSKTERKRLEDKIKTQRVNGDPSLSVKLPERETEHAPRSTAEVYNACSYASKHRSAFIMCYLGAGVLTFNRLQGQSR
jgi:hypothetical protein